eukprot:scaffold38914_cov21-Tisochrysis_lutea.AAC.1
MDRGAGLPSPTRLPYFPQEALVCVLRPCITCVLAALLPIGSRGNGTRVRVAMLHPLRAALHQMCACCNIASLKGLLTFSLERCTERTVVKGRQLEEAKKN